MRWTRDELHEIAGFLARRFPDLSLSDWRRTIEDHAADGQLHALLDDCLERHPEDANLAALRDVVAPPSRTPRRLLAASATLGVALGLAAAFVLALSQPTSPEEDLVMVDVSTPATPAPLEALQPQSIEPVGPPLPEEALQQSTVSSVTEVEPAAPSGLVPSRRCRSGSGIIGYWYAGRANPGQAGEVIEVPRDVNVRGDYPTRDNGYDVRAPIRCILKGGDRVRLHTDPIHVDGGAWWVPLTAGSVLVDA